MQIDPNTLQTNERPFSEKRKIKYGRGETPNVIDTKDHYFDVETAYNQVRRLEQMFDTAEVITLPKKTKKPKKEAS